MTNSHDIARKELRSALIDYLSAQGISPPEGTEAYVSIKLEGKEIKWDEITLTFVPHGPIINPRF